VHRGDICHVDLNPIKGREQAGPRYVLIVSPQAFNLLGTPLVCPITQGGSFARNVGFALSVSGTGTQTQGVVRCNCPRRAVHLEGARLPHGRSAGKARNTARKAPFTAEKLKVRRGFTLNPTFLRHSTDTGMGTGFAFTVIAMTGAGALSPESPGTSPSTKQARALRERPHRSIAPLPLGY
jgi:mRNA interferase ChpB